MIFINKYKIVGHLFFGILIVLSVLYYLERTIFVDSAWQYFKLLQTQRFNVEAGRYGAVISQILPLIVIKLGFSLKTVLLTISVSYIILYYAVYNICVHKLKNDAAGLALVFLMCLCVRDNFYYPVAEAQQGLVYSILFFSWLNFPIRSDNKHLNKWVSFAVSMMLIALCYFTHPFTIFPILFIIGYYIIEKQKWRDPKIYLLVVFTILIFSLKLLFTAADSYEGDHFSQLNNFFELIPDYFNLFSTQFLIMHSGVYSFTYVYVEIMLLCVMVYYLVKKQYLKLAFMLLSIIGFLLVTNIIYHRGDAGMIMEKNLIPLSIFVGIPFANDILLKGKFNQYIKLLVLVAILFIRIKDIGKTSKTYTQRLHYIERVCDYTKQFPERKFLIENKNIDGDRIKVNWAFSIETLLFSSLDNPNEARTVFVTEDINSLNVDIQSNKLFLAPNYWRDIHSDELNNEYFNIPDGPYRILSDKIE